MKVCKIILIIIFVVKAIVELIKSGTDRKDPVAKTLGTLVAIIVSGLLYWGAGIFDL